MTDIPWKAFTGLSAISTYVLVDHQPKLLPFARPSYLGTFIQLWILQFLAWAFWRVILWPKYFSPLRRLPGPPPGSWWNGNFGEITAKPSGIPMQNWVSTIPNNGLIRYLGLLNGDRIIVTSPQALREVLVTKNYDWIKPAQIAQGLGRLLGIGILLAEGEEHKMQRKNLLPAFQFRHIKNLYPVFWEKSREAVEAMTLQVKSGVSDKPDAEYLKDMDVDESAGGTVIEIGDWASRATLDIIGIAGLGQDFGAIKDPTTTLNATYRTVFKPSRQAQFLQLLNLLFPAWFVKRLPLKRNGDIERAVAVIRSVCRKLIRAKKEKLEKNELTDVDILSVAIESGAFTEENLINQLMTFLAAGHETTATSTTWAIYMLCLNPDIQKRLRAEIRENLPSPTTGVPISSQHIDQMPYLNAVCSESLRYYAPVPLTIRDAVRDTVIVGEHIPKGTRVMLVPWAINKSEELWGPDARKFNPDRWMPDKPYSGNGGAPSAYSFLTFLHGPRSCIGQEFAKAEFACLLGALVGRFEFEIFDKKELEEKNVLIKGGVTARPAKGMYLRTKVVDGW